MKIKQLNKENGGVEWNGEVAPFEGYQHHDGLWFQNNLHVTYKPLAVEIYDNIIKPNKIKSVLELGSGAGSLAFFLRELSNNELLVITLDGNKDTVNSPYVEKDNHFIVRTDRDYQLVDDNENTIIFDLVISFEHFEHIVDGENFNIFLKNIKKHINKETILFCTGSLSTTSGGVMSGFHWHPNVKSYEEWNKYLNENGFELEKTCHLKDENCPFNFGVGGTNELFFRLR